MVTAAEQEFEDTNVDPATEVATPKAEAPAGPTAEDLAGLKAENARLGQELAGLKDRAAVVDRLQEVFTGVGKAADPKDAYVRKEIERLVPELGDVAKNFPIDGYGV